MKNKNEEQLKKQLADMQQELAKLQQLEAERKQAEEEFRESEERYRTLTNNLNVGVYRNTIGPKGRFIEVNAAIIKMFGYKNKNEFISLNVSDLYQDPKDRLKFNNDLINEGFIKDRELVLKKKDGTTFIASVSAVAVKDENGGMQFYDGIIEDITERKLAEEALRKSRERFRYLVENTSDWIWEVDSNGIYTYVSPKIQELLGYEPNEVTGKKPFDFMPADEAKRIARLFSAFVKSKEAFAALENINIHKDGSHVILETSGVPVLDADGNLLGYRGIDRDITERKRAEELIRKSEERYRHFVERSPNPIFSIDNKGKIKSWNQACEKVFKYSKDIIGSDYQILILEKKDRYSVESMLPDTFQGHSLSNVDISFKCKDGKVLYMVSRLYPLTDDEGRIQECVFANTDITERKQAEKALKESEEKFRSLAEQSPNMIFINKKGRVVYANKKCEDIIGYKREEFYSPDFDFLTIIAPEYIEIIKSNFNKHLKGKDIEPYEYALITKDGKKIETIITTKLINYKDDKAILGIVTDITTVKRSEKALKESERKYQRLSQEFSGSLDSLPDSITFLDAKLKIIWANKAAANAFHRKTKEYVGKYCYKLWHNRNIPCEECLLLEAVQTQLPAVGEIITPDGRCLEIRGIPIIENDEVRGVAEIARDMTERKFAEQALRDSERRFADIIQFLPDPTCVVDSNGEIIAWNQALEQITRVKAEEMLGKGNHEYSLPFYGKRRPVLLDLIFQPDNKEIRKFYSFIEKHGDTLISEIYIPSFNGGTYFWVSARPVYDSNGEVVGAISTVRDITESKQAEAALRESEEKFRDLFENATDAIYTVDLEGNFISGNKMAEMISGYQKEELIGKNFLAIVVEEDRQKIINGFNKTLSGQRYSYELRIKRKDGKIRILSVNSAPIIKDAEIIGTQAIARDITERKVLEKKLRESEEKFKGIFENANDIIIIIDKQGYIALANPRFYEVTRFSAEEVRNMHFYQFLHPDDVDSITYYFKNALAGKIDYQRFEARAFIKDSSLKYLDINYNIIKKDEEIIGIQAVIRDVTEKKLLEERLKQNYNELITTIAAFIEIKDLYTEEHSRRIVEDSIYLAQQFGMSEIEIKDIEIAALLHDLGKIKIPGKILNKPGKLNKREEKIMRKHCQLGEEAIMNMPEFSNASKLIKYHHERYDGKGYPEGLKGQKIPLGARIIAMVDAFDAMRSNRPYRRALNYKEAKQELIKERGKQFDPQIIDIYLQYLKVKYKNTRNSSNNPH